MDEKIISSVTKRIETEPYARKLALRLVKLEPGRALVEMPVHDEMGNIFGMVHGGAIFSLIDEAFQASCNSHGTVALALNVNVTYHQPPQKKGVLKAESVELHRSKRTATYQIRVTDEEERLIASCLALAYRKGEPLPFLK
jgi:acyl-CoA thioesterase